MRRRICLAVGLVALAVPASGWAQSSSQAQYQGVAPETQVPITGGGGPSGGGGAAVTGSGGGSTATGGGRPASGGGAKATAGKGSGGSATATAGVNRGGTKAPVVSLPSASSSTSPFGGNDIVWIVLAVAGLVALGLVLRRGTGHSPSGA